MDRTRIKQPFYDQIIDLVIRPLSLTDKDLHVVMDRLETQFGKGLRGDADADVKMIQTYVR